MHEPCVGGGVFVIAFAKKCKEKNIGPWRWWFDASDIDIRCARMSYIQLTLCGAPGIVRHQNTISMEQWAAWPTLHGIMFPHFWPEQEQPRMTLAEQRRYELKQQMLNL
jgi:hypothetical protein